MTIFEIKQHFKNSALPRHWWQGWLCFVLDKSATFLISSDDYSLSDDEQIRFLHGIDEMKKGTPLAYLLGEQEFFGRRFFVNENTLIPRPDTERLVEVVLDWLSSKNLKQGTILDLGTGSGCIAITLDKELTNRQANFDIVAVDFSDDALQIAKKNAKNLSANCQFMQSNWFEKVAGRYDVVVSNPPYIACDDAHLANLTKEPMSALVSGDDGLVDIAQIVHDARDFLKTGGLLAIEHGHDQKNGVQAIFLKHDYHDVQTIKDYGGNDRLTMGIWHG